MGFNVCKVGLFEQKMLSWAYVGLLLFISAFLWSPSRDGLQGVYYLAFFLPMLLVLSTRKPDFNEYGGWMTISALVYGGFSAISALWSEQPTAVGFFALQWCLLAVWLCGSSLLFSRRDVNLQKYLQWFVVLGGVITAITLVHYYGFVSTGATSEIRLYGWNVFRNANEIGAMCGVFSLLAFVTALQSTRPLHALCFFLLAVIAGVGLAASFSRGALVAFAIMSAIAVVVYRPPLKIWLPPLLLVLVAVAAFFSLTDFVMGFAGRSVAIDERFEVWNEVLKRSHDNIFAGIGMTKDSRIFIPNGDIFNHAHNAWLDTFYRTGLIGLLLVLLHLASVVKVLRRHAELLPFYLWLGYGCICSLFDSRCFFWEIGAKWFFYWIPIGLIVAGLTGISFRARRAGVER